jgi:hypothetical protein
MKAALLISPQKIEIGEIVKPDIGAGQGLIEPAKDVRYEVL